MLSTTAQVTEGDAKVGTLFAMPSRHQANWSQS